MSKVSRDFQIFVKPVGSLCNLNCTYCYYLGKGSSLETGPGTMMEELVAEYIRQHIEATSSETVFFSWHGGEPTMAGLSFYKAIVEQQKKYNREGKRIINGIQTNATFLNAEWAEFFAENDFLIGISIDGPERLHNIYRKGMGTSNGSFNAVISGWKALKDAGVTYEILCTLNDNNSRHPDEVYSFFRENGARHITFLPVVDRGRNGGLLDWSVDPVVFGDFLIRIFDLWKESDIGKIDIQIIDEALRPAINREHSLCIFRKECGAVPVVEKDGNVYACDHYVSDDYLLGNIKSLSLAEIIDSKELKDFGSLKRSSLPSQCLECDVIDMCNGGCPRNRFTIIPGEKFGLNYLCPGYLKFFKHVKPFSKILADLGK